MAMAQEIRTYTDLLQKIHDDLRVQHPEWIQQNGKSPMCDSYEARLMELLDASRPIESNENIGKGAENSETARHFEFSKASL
jgi:hypothetical protein